MTEHDDGLDPIAQREVFENGKGWRTERARPVPALYRGPQASMVPHGDKDASICVATLRDGSIELQIETDGQEAVVRLLPGDVDTLAVLFEHATRAGR